MFVESTCSILTLCMQPLLALEYNSESSEESDSVAQIALLRFYYAWLSNTVTDGVVLAWLGINLCWSATRDTTNSSDTWILVANLPVEHRLLQSNSKFP